MKKINLTPHEIKLNDGTVFPPSGQVARVRAEYVEIRPGEYITQYGRIEGLPDPAPDTQYIVSALVAMASDRDDLITPATGHPLARRENGQIVSVPGFNVKK